MLLRFWFSKALSNKIFLALILNRKFCICCCKHCIAYFRRHMECAVLKRFLKVQGTFSIKKFLQIPLSIWKKLNLIRFVKTLIKLFTSHPFRYARHLLPREGFKTLPSSYACHLPFQRRLSGRLPWKGSCHAVTEGFAFSLVEKVLSHRRSGWGVFSA